MNDTNRVLVIGDAMIDTYVYGSVKRVSPEAPVPVICPQKEVNCLGGAANVARNAAALGATVTAMFAVGKDRISEVLKEQLNEYGVKCGYLVQDENQSTINKVRIVGNDQQIVRIDYHDKYYVSEELQQAFLATFDAIVDDNDIVVISDYGKGTCSESLCREIISICRKMNKPVIVDPKGINWEKYRGATMITPNMKEVNIFSGKDVANDSAAIEKEYGDLPCKIGVDYLLLTRSEYGMSLLSNGDSVHISADTHEVYDVSGAGDTVVAALAANLKVNLKNVEEAVRISNIAAGIVVAKPGTAVATREEILEKMANEVKNMESQKIFSIDDYHMLEKKLKLWKTAREKIVTTNGCFDIVHCGHIKLLEEAKKLGNRLIVAINSDNSVKRLKGEKRPVNSEMDRAYLLAAIKVVDAVVIFDPKVTPYELSDEEKGKLSEKAIEAAREAPMAVLNLILPDIHIKGGDYAIEDIPEAIFAKEVAFVPFVDGYSTTSTIHKIISK